MGLKRWVVALLALVVFALESPAIASTEPRSEQALIRDARAVLLVGFAGTDLDLRVRHHLEDGGRGVILFSTNIGQSTQLRRLTSKIACTTGSPVLIATDQELGRVQRLRGLVTPTPTPSQTIEGSAESAVEVARRLGRDLIGLGINMDLAPVLDVVRGPNPVLAGRAYPGEAATVAGFGSAFSAGLHSAGVVATAKHFPGHGLSSNDPHIAVTRISADLETLESDLEPFRSALAAGVKAVMVGHPIYETLDPNLPASLSPTVLAYLRDTLGFTGVAVTDGLSMTAVRVGRSFSEVVVQALRAGEDLLIVEDVTELDTAVNAIVEAVRRGDLSRERVAQSAARVRTLAAWATQPTCPTPPPDLLRN
jgi:beta-N-acetylhexosaminidase